MSNSLISKTERQIETDRDRQTPRHRERETETDRQGQTDRQRDRDGKTDRQTDRQTETHINGGRCIALGA